MTLLPAAQPISALARQHTPQPWPGVILRVVLVPPLLLAFRWAPDGTSHAWAWAMLAIFYWLLASAVVRPDTLRPKLPTFATAEALFLAFCFLLFYLPYQLNIFGQFDLTRSRFIDQTFIAQSNRALTLTTIGVLAFSAGVRWPRRRTRAIDPKRDGAPQRAQPDSQLIRELATLDAIVLAALVIGISLYVGLGFRSVAEGRYTNTTTGGSAAEGLYLLILMFCMMTVALFVARLALGHKLVVALWLALALAAAWSIRIVILGDRNSFILIALVAVVGVASLYKRVSRTLLIALLVGGILFYNAIEMTRRSPDKSVGAVLQALANPGEAAGRPRSGAVDSSFNISTIQVRASIAAVPDLYPRGHGKYFLIGVAGIVPLIRGLTIDPSTSDTTTSDVLAHIMLPPFAGYSVGTNPFSDAYIDIGLIGVPLELGLVGLWVRRRRRLLGERPDSVRQIIMYLLTVALVAEMPRYTVGFPIRILVWTSLVLAIAVLDDKRRRSRANR